MLALSLSRLLLLLHLLLFAPRCACHMLAGSCLPPLTLLCWNSSQASTQWQHCSGPMPSLAWEKSAKQRQQLQQQQRKLLWRQQ
jgi:hypothetical protein